MDNESPAAALSSTAQKGKRHRRSGKPSGPQTAPSTPQSATPEAKKPEVAPGESKEEMLDVANAALKAAMVRYQQFGGELMTINENGVSWIRIRGLKFKAPGTASVDMEVASEQKPPAPAAQK